MSDIKMTIEYCTCCLHPVEQCKAGQPVAVISIDCPIDEDVREDVSRMDI